MLAFGLRLTYSGAYCPGRVGVFLVPEQTDKNHHDKEMELADILSELDGLRRENRELRHRIDNMMDTGESLVILAENSVFPTAVFDGDHKLRHLNSKFTEEFGYAPEDMPDRLTWRTKLFPREKDRKVILHNVAEWEKRHTVGHRHHEISITCKDGGAREAVINVFVLPGAWLFVFVQDVTSRKRSEDYIRQSEARFKASFDSAPNGMALISPERRFLAVNRQLCIMLGHKPHEMLGKSFNAFTHPEDRQGGRERYQRMLGGLENSNSAEKRYLRKDGSVIWMLVSNSVIKDKAGKLLHVVAHFMDLTERKKAEAESLERERLAVAIQTAGASCHELNQPLQVALAQTEVALMSLGEETHLRQRIEGIMDQINRIGSITKRLQNLTQYRTKTYLGDTKILDLDESSKQARE